MAGTGLVIVAIRVALRCVSLPTLLRWLTWTGTTKNRDESDMDDIVYYVERWLALAPYNPKGNCFPRALALYWFARRMGLCVQFYCGVMKLRGILEGHAWLMQDGRGFCEPSPHWRSFTVTLKFPPIPDLPDHPPSS